MNHNFFSTEVLARFVRAAVLVLPIDRGQHVGSILAHYVSLGVVVGHNDHVAIANRLGNAKVH